ncbi:MAG: S8 family peptidase [Bacteroidota bacterium]
MNTTTFSMKDASVANLKNAFFFFLMMGTSLILTHAQTVIYSESFDFPTQAADTIVPSGWTVQNLADSGPGPSPNDTLWRRTADGTASNGAYWDGRFRIASPSGSTGAIVFDSDFLDNAGIPGASCAAGAPVISCAPHEGVITSPSFDASNFSSITLKFYQYFRGFNSRTYVEVTTDSGMNWTTFQVNQDLTDLPFGGESERFDPIILNISSVAANQADVQIRFRFEGEYYFWIVDDIFVLGNSAVEDIVMDEIVWPDPDLRCYLGEEEYIRIRLRNQGQSPQVGFSINYGVFGQAQSQGTESFSDTIPSNESIVVTLNTAVDMRRLSFIQAEVSSQLDDDTTNNQTNFEVPFPCELCTDSLGGQYICDQVLVQFAPSTPPTLKKSIRESYNDAERIDVCGCDTLEVWRVQYPFESPTGDSIFGGEEIVPVLIGQVEIEEAGTNNLVKLDPMDTVNLGLMYTPPETSTSTNVIKVGLLDTGLDFNHPALKNRFWKNATELSDPFAPDDDANCFEHDNWGLNLFNPGSQPFDNHNTGTSMGHGTHVGGTILEAAPSCVNTELMVVKILAQNGKGGLFEMVCGMKYAQEKNAEILNVSVGYTGNKSLVLEKAVSNLQDKGILLVTSAGNSKLDNAVNPHWPSNFTQTFNNVLAVASTDPNDNLSSFSNWSPMHVDIAAPGELVLSTLPGNQFGLKSGTSMSSALVSRASSFYWSANPGVDYNNVRAEILNTADSPPSLAGFVIDQKRLATNDSLFATCLMTSIEEELLAEFESYPNPFDQQMTISFTLDQPADFELRVYNPMGQLIHQGAKAYPPGEGRYVWETLPMAKGLYIFQVFIDGELAQSGKWLHR